MANEQKPHSTAASQASDAGWRPMDTAPTDGTEVIVRIREKVIRLGWYFKPSSRTEGWCDENGNSIKPIAWMPLPLATLTAPPTSDAGGAK